MRQAGDSPSPKVWLRQVTGLSVGSSAPLRDGLLELGPRSRRAKGSENADPLDLATAPLIPVLQLHVNGATVRLKPTGVPIQIDGNPVLAATELRPGQRFGTGSEEFIIETNQPHRRRNNHGEVGPLLVTGRSKPLVEAVLASLTIDLLAKPARKRHLYVIDSVDRRLIRLRQLPETRHYIAGDDPNAMTRLLDNVTVDLASAHLASILIVNSFGPLLTFLRSVARRDIATRLLDTLSQHDLVRLTAAVAGPTAAGLTNTHRERFSQHLVCEPTGNGELQTPDDNRVVPLIKLADYDLNASVARRRF